MKIFGRAAPMLGLLGIAFLAVPLAAAPRSIKDCEKIQAADAYNRCLASFGPVAHMHGMTSGSGGDEGGGDVGGGDSAAPRPSRHGYHRAHERQHIVIDGGSSAAHAHRHWHWHHHRHH